MMPASTGVEARCNAVTPSSAAAVAAWTRRATTLSSGSRIAVRTSSATGIQSGSFATRFTEWRSVASAPFVATAAANAPAVTIVTTPPPSISSGNIRIEPSTPVLRSSHDAPNTWNSSDKAETTPL